MMDLAELIEPSRCLVDLRYADKAACLGDLAKRAAAMLGLEPAAVLEALRAREALGSTGLGNGIAVPHARLASVAAPFVLVARLREPIPFEAVDDKPVDVVCLALLPAAKAAPSCPCSPASPAASARARRSPPPAAPATPRACSPR